MISLCDITLGYGSRTLLEGASATFGEGTFTALLGRNGAGKSTLLRAMAALGPVAAGRITVGGRDMAAMSAAERARMVSIVTTERVRIANLACRQVVALGRAPYTGWSGRLGADDAAAVERALEAVGMSDFAGKSMDRMSDGECQRIMIARALAQQTPVILLDEPCAFLDLPARYDMHRLLSSLAHDEGKTIIFSTHDLDSAAACCDNIALIATPHLVCRPAQEMLHSGEIELAFGLEAGALARRRHGE